MFRLICLQQHTPRLRAAPCPTCDLKQLFLDSFVEYDVIISDECQFFSAEQIDMMRDIVDEFDIPVLCFGLRSDFKTNLFEGSARLFAVADSISEIKTICECGRKATVNARLDSLGRVITEGEQVQLGGNDSYTAMCHKCWRKAILKEKKNG